MMKNYKINVLLILLWSNLSLYAQSVPFNADELIKAASTYKQGQERTSFFNLETTFNKSNPADRAVLEKALLKLIADPAATTDAKLEALILVARYGSSASIPAILEAAQDPLLESYALLTLENLCNTSIPEAVVKGLKPKTAPAWRILIKTNSTEILQKAVDQLQSQDVNYSRALLRMIAHQGTAEAAKALQSASLPEALAVDRDRALVECANRMTKNGHLDQAIAYLTSLQDKSKPKPVQIAATVGLILNKMGAHPTPEVLKSSQATLLGLLSSSDLEMQKAGMGLIHYFPDLQFLVEPFSNTSREIQVAIMTQLNFKPSSSFVPAITKLILSNPDEELTKISIMTLGRIGDASIVDFLIQQRKAHKELKTTYDAALIALSDPNANAKIRSIWTSESPELAIAMIKVISQRVDREAFPELMKISLQESNPLAPAAWIALGDLSTQETFPAIIQNGVSLEGSTVIEAHKTALALGIKRIGEKQKLLPLLKEGYNQAANKKSAGSYIYALGQIKTPEANKFLIGIVKSGSDQAKIEAIKVVSENAEPLIKKDLKEITQKSTIPTVKIMALRGYIKVLGSEVKRPAAERFSDFKEAMTLAERADEQRLIVDSITTIKDDHLKDFIRSLVVLPDVKADIENALQKIDQEAKTQNPSTKK